MRVILDHDSVKEKIREFVNNYPDGFHIDWLEHPKCDWDKAKLANSLPIDIFYKLFPITATWTMRKRHHKM